MATRSIPDRNNYIVTGNLSEWMRQIHGTGKISWMEIFMQKLISVIHYAFSMLNVKKGSEYWIMDDEKSMWPVREALQLWYRPSSQRYATLVIVLCRGCHFPTTMPQRDRGLVVKQRPMVWNHPTINVQMLHMPSTPWNSSYCHNQFHPYLRSANAEVNKTTS